MKSVSATLLVGAGRMGSALLKGWVARHFTPIVVVEPAPAPALKNFARANRIPIFKTAADIGDTTIADCVVALKPQVLANEAQHLRRFAECGALMLSIAAGTRIANLRAAWGPRARVVRAMPNTPGAIGRGITALYAPRRIAADGRKRAERLVVGLGEMVWVKSEQEIDVVTAVSGSGPAYVFLLVEALAAAAEKEGLKRDIAEKLARATIVGAGALLENDARSAGELRRDVTSSGGTTEAALSVLAANPGLRELLARAVSAARKRATELSGGQ